MSGEKVPETATRISIRGGRRSPQVYVSVVEGTSDAEIAPLIAQAVAAWRETWACLDEAKA